MLVGLFVGPRPLIFFPMESLFAKVNFKRVRKKPDPLYDCEFLERLAWFSHPELILPFDECTRIVSDVMEHRNW